jgi:hypothetical protein
MDRIGRPNRVGASKLHGWMIGRETGHGGCVTGLGKEMVLDGKGGRY